MKLRTALANSQGQRPVAYCIFFFVRYCRWWQLYAGFLYHIALSLLVAKTAMSAFAAVSAVVAVYR
jgi:hypothetical protein